MVRLCNLIVCVFFLLFTSSGYSINTHAPSLELSVSSCAIDSVDITNESCCGSNGSISIYASSFSNLRYSIDSLNTFQTSIYFDSLSSGDYLLYVEDDNGCMDSVVVTLSFDSIPDIDMTIESTNIICFGDTNGTLKIHSPDLCYDYILYRYTFLTPQVVIDTGIYFNELTSGFYGVVAISQDGACKDSSSIRYIQDPDPIIYDTPLTKSVYCMSNDICNGEIQLPIEPTGGQGPYEYYATKLFANIPTPTISTDSILGGICPGIYLIKVIDAKACIAMDTVIVLDSSLYIDSFLTTYTSCFGSSDGAITVYAHGGLGQLSYLWSDGSTSQSIDSLNRGQYLVSVQDSVSCYSMDSTFIDHPDTVLFKIIENGKVPETCLGISYDGEIILEISGGTPPYSHSWSTSTGISGAGIGDTIFNLTADTIILSVIDSNGCTGSPSWGTVNITIVEASNAENPLVIDNVFTNTSPICNGVADGIIQIKIASGDSAYQFSIDNGVTYSVDSNFTNLFAGVYNIMVLDIHGCSDSIQVRIEEYDEMMIEIDSIKNVSCYNGHDGFLSFSVDGGASPYKKLWNYPLSLREIICFDNEDGIAPIGAFTWSYKDFEIPQGFKLDSIYMDASRSGYPLDEYDFSAEYCAGANMFTPGTAISLIDYTNISTSLYNNWERGFPIIPYKGIVRVWLPTGAGATWNNLCFAVSDSISESFWRTDGMYTMKVVDSAGCIKTDSASLIELTNPIQSHEAITEHVSCHSGFDGSAFLEVIGGLTFEDGSYDFIWTKMNNDTISINNPATELEAGVYLVSINDSFSCGPFIDTVVIQEPTLFFVDLVSVSNNLCFDDEEGGIIVQSSGGTAPYAQYFIMDNSLVINNQNTGVFNNLYSNIFSIWSEDSKGCLSDTLSNIKLGQPANINVNSVLFEPQCFHTRDGVLQIVLIGGTNPYEYTMVGDGNDLVGQGVINQGESFEIHDLYKGTFSFQMVDFNNCIFDTTYIVSSPNEVVADFNTSLTSGWEALSVDFFNQSIDGNLFTWDFDDGSIISTGFNDAVNHIFLNQGQYEVSLVASNSSLSSICNDTTIVEVNVEGFDNYNVFSPNQDGFNDYFNFGDWGLSSLEVEIFNRWGQKVYHWNLENNNWDGKGYNGEDLPEGVYYFSIKTVSNTGFIVNQNGNITLLR